ncbi:SsgA family sporulation/cell division regulator [Streptomyces sp. TRM66268-LWL]|uniref:SsgA family sporulation/cell division regulator n=1 Tax=Streptomyces polyasparticus TaxID=2767826 RepID=A0ABR7SPP9_9ACTN|nr:SsgA family sporulation/cell division regulator [Streptomyces polyasparticus]MBC9716829.1 SsgA family sporulation/cell division regulator [Streptomyces polyasparticus]
MDEEQQTPAVEVCTRAHLVTDADSGDTHRAVRVSLRYSPQSEVRIVIVGDDTPGWSLPREVLEQGMSAPAASETARVWPCGRVATVVEFHTGQGVAVLQFDSARLTRFLKRTRKAPAPVNH